MPTFICENCGLEYEPHYPSAQRWCGEFCRSEFRNAEARAARKVWRMAGKPKRMIEEAKQHDTAAA
jgi:rubredoxin